MVVSDPTRGRGQWLADVANAGLDIAAVAYRDLRPFRRALAQYAQCARQDGLVAAVVPGEPAYLANNAALWLSDCLHYYRLTGDRALLVELWRPALFNIAALERDPVEPGVPNNVFHSYIDRAHDRPGLHMDVATNLYFLEGLEAAVAWAQIIEKKAPELQERADALRERLGAVIDEARAGDEWERLGYHATALALDQGFFTGDTADAAVKYLKWHIGRCFPNDPDGPRVTDPLRPERYVFSPVFAHESLPVLVRHGQMSFVFDQYRTCWGWALDQGLTTWPEMFDLRWSHCHHAAGVPTWQLSRYVLGLHPRFDRGVNHFDFHLESGGLTWAEGVVPLPEGEAEVAWKEEGGAIAYALRSSAPIHVAGVPGEGETVVVDGEVTWELTRE